MRVRVTHTIGDLADDLAHIARTARTDMVGVVRDGLRAGNTLAKDSAKRTAGAHGKHYHRAFSYEMHRSLFGRASDHISGEYGPDIGKRQGRMKFERGSRNQPPHLDLAKSADIIGGSFAQEVRALPDKWFWRG